MICGDLPPQEDRGDLGSGAVASSDEALLGGIRGPGGVGHCMSVGYERSCECACVCQVGAQMSVHMHACMHVHAKHMIWVCMQV